MSNRVISNAFNHTSNLMTAIQYELMNKFRHTIYWNLTVISDDGKWANNVASNISHLLITDWIISLATWNLFGMSVLFMFAWLTVHLQYVFNSVKTIYLMACFFVYLQVFWVSEHTNLLATLQMYEINIKLLL